MKRLVIVALLGLFATQAVAPALAARTVVRKGPNRTVVVRKGPYRTRVVVHRSFPIRRAWPVVLVRPARVAVIAPAVFLAPLMWRPVVVGVPSHKRVVWSGSETLHKADGWTEFTVQCGRPGDSIFLELAGKAQLQFAEVVFHNGEALVVDFKESTHGSGHYSMIDFRDGRTVDHVRIVARAKTTQATITLKVVT